MTSSWYWHYPFSHFNATSDHYYLEIAKKGAGADCINSRVRTRVRITRDWITDYALVYSCMLACSSSYYFIIITSSDDIQPSTLLSG